MYRLYGISYMSVKNKIKKYLLRKKLAQLIKRGDVLKKQANQKSLALIVDEIRPELASEVIGKFVVVKVPCATLSELTEALKWMTVNVDRNNLPRRDFFAWSKTDNRFLDQFITLDKDQCYTDPVKEVSAFKEALKKFLEAIKFSDGEELDIPGRYNYVCRPFVKLLTALTIDIIVASIV